MAEENKVPTVTAPLEGIAPKPKIEAKSEVKVNPKVAATPKVAVKVQENKVDAKLHPVEPPFRIVSAGKKKKRNYFNGMLYGEFGVGKTLFSSTAQDVPEMRDVIYIEADGGDKVLRRRSDIDEIEKVREYNKVGRIYEFLKKHCYYRDKNDKENLIRIESIFKGIKVTEPKIYNTVIIDTLNEIQKYCMNQILGINTDNWKLDAEPIRPVGEDWGTDLTMIRWLVSSFRDLPMHTIFICAEDVLIDKAKVRHIHPALPGKLVNEVQGILDTVGYYKQFVGEDNKIHRRLYLTPGSNYQAKNRWDGWNGISLLDPTMAKLYELEKQYG